MKSNKICNPKKEVPEGISLNDQDYMTMLLSNLKWLVKNMTVSLTEASNSKLYTEYKSMFDNLIKHQRACYELMFKFGWYSLEQADVKKISTLSNDLDTQLKNLEK